MLDRKRNSFLFLIYLVGLSIIGFLATDMYLPAFDRMRLDLSTDKSSISASLSLFLAGYALAQLFWGPIADKIGKPKTILIGLTLFTLASLCIFFTNDVLSLLVLRLLQAIGVCAAAVSWQALVVEYYPASQTNKIFATIMPMVALSPALAPLLGVYLLQHFGWRSIFITLAGIAVLLMLYTFTLMRQQKSDAPVDIKTGEKTKQSYFSLLKSNVYVGNVLIYAFCSGSFFAWLTGSPFFLKELGYDESQIGLSFVPQTIAFMLGGYGYRALANSIETKKLMPVLLILYSVSLLAIYSMSVMTTPTLTLLLIPFCGMALANGACYPIVVAQALRVFPNDLGKAAGLQNAIQLGICFIASAIVSVFSKDALLATSIVMVGTIPFMLIAYRLTVKGK